MLPHFVLQIWKIGMVLIDTILMPQDLVESEKFVIYALKIMQIIFADFFAMQSLRPW